MKRYFVIALALSCTACATGYQQYTWSGGYKDKELGDGKYLVEYFGNGTTSQHTVAMFWGQRANELCPNGFEILDDEDGQNSGSFTSGSTSFSHPWKKATIKCK